MWYRLFWSFASLVLLVLLLCGVVLLYFQSQLPDVETLKEMQLRVPLRVYTADKQLIAEYGEMRRIPVTLDQIPKPLIQAILATEDQRFFEHAGVDFLSLGGAAVELVRTGTKSRGGSTITMQVARNFYLTKKKTFWRKFNEILLAFKIDQSLSKEKILELYLNKIYLGNRAYGVAAAAQIYFGKPLNQLSVGELAMIAGLPKAPSAINPIANLQAAKKRRNHVLQRMHEEGYINDVTYNKAINEPLIAKYYGHQVSVQAPYVGEMVRQILVEKYGLEVYSKGVKVYTTIDSTLQLAANQALQNALSSYDQRYGYRGPLLNLGSPTLSTLQEWLERLKDISSPAPLEIAAVIHVSNRNLTALLADGHLIEIPWEGLSWARRKGNKPSKASDIAKVGDVIRVISTSSQVAGSSGDPVNKTYKSWRLSQLPEVEGALVSLSPYDGAVKSLVGGYNFYQSHYNRITQAKRQPGSSFKPFIYAAALEKGYTLATVINDAPIVVEDVSLAGLWRPQNHTRKFSGPTRLREALTTSRNLVSIRLLELVGIPYTINYLKRFGFKDADLPKSLSLALGTLSITPMELTAAYAAFANGGYKVEPNVIQKIVDSNDEIMYQSKPLMACSKCNKQQQAPQIISPQVAYMITNTMQDVVQRGTARPIADALKRRDIAGKTGTTNDHYDAWFAGFNPDLVTTVWIGYDQPRSLREYSSSVAIPIWSAYMQKALANKPERGFVEPEGLAKIRIDPKTGLLARDGQKDAIVELFQELSIPKQQAQTEDVDPYNNPSDSSESGSGEEQPLW